MWEQKVRTILPCTIIGNVIAVGIILFMHYLSERKKEPRNNKFCFNCNLNCPNNYNACLKCGINKITIKASFDLELISSIYLTRITTLSDFSNELPFVFVALHFFSNLPHASFNSSTLHSRGSRSFSNFVIKTKFESEI